MFSMVDHEVDRPHVSSLIFVFGMFDGWSIVQLTGFLLLETLIRSWAVLGPSWAALGRSLALLGRSRAVLGSLWLPLGRS